ncbi:MAG: tRNA (guanosine(37)-N1)-methyltransferase TrmD [Clostridia bacterium]|nr:tRNA (guanosine(37)-N1)-methyltransferase TrmD [Clostridia bacterium]
MKIKVLTLFPEAYDGLKVGILDRALKADKFSLELYQIRDYSKDKHHKVDDAPFGGGAGMLMTPQPIYDAVMAADPDHACRRIYLSPKGRTLTQSGVVSLAEEENLLFLCGSYEGVDQRVLDLTMDEELSIGDYVLTSGDLPCMVAINAISRYLDGVLGSEESTSEESFSEGLLEYPQYTRPQEFMGLRVPEVLVGGNHAEVAAWRHARQLELTEKLRPDLLKKDRK